METSNDNLIQNWTSNDLFINREALEQAFNNITASITGVKSHDPIISCCSNIKTEPNTVTLKADYKESKYLVEKNPEQMDKLIKEELALRLARKMIDEDLIKIYQGYNLGDNTINFHAEVKIIQE